MPPSVRFRLPGGLIELRGFRNRTSKRSEAKPLFVQQVAPSLYLPRLLEGDAVLQAQDMRQLSGTSKQSNFPHNTLPRPSLLLYDYVSITNNP